MLAAGFEIRDDEQNAERQIDQAETENERRDAALQVERGGGDRKAEFFDDRRPHHRAVAGRVARDDEEDELESERDADKTVEIFRVRDGRRKIAIVFLLEKILRRERDDAVDTGDIENVFSELHIFESAARRPDDLTKIDISQKKYRSLNS